MPTATPAADHRPAGRLATEAVEHLVDRAMAPVSADSTAVFRIGFGLVVAVGSVRFLVKGWVDTLYLEPVNHLTYRGFGWVEPLPAPFMQLLVSVLAMLGLCIAVGYRHRWSTGLFLAGFAYTELIESSLYLNHYWFVTVTAALLLILPVQHRWSLDAHAGRVTPALSVPAIVVWALRGQLAVVYLFAGLAKLNPDWLLRAQPMRLWLADRTDTAIVGPLLDEAIVAFAASWAGAAFDCTIVGFLLWPRSRPLAYAILVGFHLATGSLFAIGVFPWLMVLATLVFFPTDWPSRVLRRVGQPPRGPTSVEPRADGGLAAPVLSGLAVGGLVLLATIQVVVPLRHYAADGNVRWNEDGYYLSWRVMLTEKAGHVDFHITDPSTGRTWHGGPELVLTDWQAGHASTRPDLIHATAHLIADHFDPSGRDGLEVRADAWVSMNGRAAARLLDPTLDLAAHPRGELPPGSVLDP